MPYTKSPVYVDETPGIKHYCTCGESKNKPYCDGSHDRLKTGKSPKEFIVQTAKRCAICDCGGTKTSPFCDGTHAQKA